MASLKLFDIVSKEINGQAVLLVVDGEAGTETPLRDNSFSYHDDAGVWFVHAVERTGVSYRHKLTHGNLEEASLWVRKLLKAHGDLEREIALRRIQQP